MMKLILTIAFCFSFPLFFHMELFNSVFAQDKDSNNSTITIPTTISSEAQEALVNITKQMPEFVPPKSNDLKAWEELNKQVSAVDFSISITCRQF